jgi:hypothetical protein
MKAGQVDESVTMGEIEPSEVENRRRQPTGGDGLRGPVKVAEADESFAATPLTLALPQERMN